MKKSVYVAVAICAAARLSAQTTEPPPAISPPATSAEVQALREEVRSLKELVQTLQHQVKSQPPATENANPNQPALPDNPETAAPETSASPAPSPNASAPPLFPTNDTAGVTSSAPGNATGTATCATPGDECDRRRSAQGRTAFRCLRPHERGPAPHLGIRRLTPRQWTSPWSRRITRGRRPGFLDAADALVFAAHLRCPKRTWRNGLLVSQPRRRRRVLQSDDDRS